MPDLAKAHKNHTYIDDVETLQTLCNYLVSLEFITIDTEFVRSRTLFPALGLVQVFDGEEVYLIDTVAIDDLSSLKPVLTQPNLLKIIHSCSEDLDALSYNIGAFPSPVFDTQIAANLLGLGNSIGYANLVEKICRIRLDKAESRTDWISRPLSNRQLDYAAADVTFLYAVYLHLKPRIDDKGWSDILFEEVTLIVQKKAKPLPAEFAYLGYSNSWKLKQKNLCALKRLAEWRLIEAQTKNIAVNFVMREQSVLDISIKLPRSVAFLSQINSITGKQVRLYEAKILEIITQVESDTSDCYPPLIQRLNDFPLYKKVGNAIKSVVAENALKTHIPEPLMASKKQINDVLKWLWFDINELDLRAIKPDLLSGWRREMLINQIETVVFSELRGTDVLRSL